jgi:hypothetical protein
LAFVSCFGEKSVERHFRSFATLSAPNGNGNAAADGSCLLLGKERTCLGYAPRSDFVKGFGCWPLEGRRREFGGRRPKASKGDAMRQAAAARKVRIWHSSALI